MTSTTTRTINLVTEIPGPKSREINARRDAAVTKGLGRGTPVVIKSGHGAVVQDVDGNTLLDFAGGIGVLAVGHTPAPVVEAMQQQLADLIHICAIVSTTESYVELCELLNQITPGDFAKKSILSNTGAEAVENAIRCARAYTKRPAVICFEGSYHGRTLLTMSLTSKYDLFKKGFGPFASDIYRLPFPYQYRRPPMMTEDQYTDYMIWQFDHALTAQVDPSAVAAVILEPVQGEGGFIPVPKRYMQHIYKRCQEHGICLVVDEVQTGFGRTGTMFAIEQYDVIPDIIITAKSIAAGMPMSAITGRAEVMDAPHPGGLGGTYGGTPVACVAAIKTIEYIQQNNLPTRALHIGDILRAEFERWQREIPMVADVRGLGSMLAVELVLNREDKTPAKTQTLDIIQEAARHGVIMIRAGLFSNCLRMLMPLTMPDDQLREGLAVIEAAIRTIARKEGLL
ncbi:MAG: 4-aminobutyrate--2-oxoglutarate transaminase [Anaerolineae bacterium]|nr:4-aminobutyrate--2-oxoglutarate transaminase [Anaerolineae bacterium]